MGNYVKLDQAGLHQLLESADGPLGKHLTKLSIKIANHAKKGMTPNGPSAPGQPPAVDTGRLRASITYELGRDGKGLVGRIGTNVSYAKHLELGTSRMRARPFLRPALAAQRGAL